MNVSVLLQLTVLYVGSECEVVLGGGSPPQKDFFMNCYEFCPWS